MKRNRRRRERGQSVVEFALTLPLLLLLIFGMLEMGWLASAKLVLDNATREGTRAGVVAETTSSATSAVDARIDALKPSYFSNNISVSVSFSNPSDLSNSNIDVVATYDLPTLTPLTAFLADNGVFHLQSECTMKMS